MSDRELTLLVLAPNPWDGPRMNRQHLFSRLGTRHRVVYSTGLRTYKGLARYRPLAHLRGSTRVRDRVTVDDPPSWLLRNLRLPAIDDLAVRVVAHRWRQMLTRPFTAYLFHPSYWPYVRFLQPEHLVYHAYDLYDRQASWCDEFAAWERRLIDSAGLVVASSTVILERLRALGARNAMLLENAGDFELFAAGPARREPDDLAAIPRPRVGYSGAINQKVSFALIAGIARRMPATQFVLVGLIAHLDATAERELDEIRTLPNVHLLGRKDYSEMPAYVGHMDVNAIWNRLDDGLWTEGTFPLKLHEYLAAGPPVVTSDIPALRQFADVLQIARSEDEWERALTTALQDRDCQALDARRTVASRNTWDARAAQLEHALRALAGASS